MSRKPFAPSPGQASTARGRFQWPASAARLVVLVVIGELLSAAQAFPAQRPPKSAAGRKKSVEPADDPDADTKVSVRESAMLRGHQGAVTRVAFHPALPLLSSASKDGRVLVWDLEQRSEGREVAKFREEVWAVKFSPNGEVLAFANRNWWGSVASFRQIPGFREYHKLKDFKDGGGAVSAMAFSPDGLLFATGQDDGTIRLWETNSFKEGQAQPLGAKVYALAFGPITADSKLKTREYAIAAGGPNGAIRTLRAIFAQNKNDLHSAIEFTDVEFPKGKAIFGLRYSRDGAFLAATREGGLISFVDPFTGASIRNLRASDAGVESVSFHPTRPWIVTSHMADKTARIWNHETGEMLCELKGHDGVVHCAEFSRDGRSVATGSEDFMVRIWQLEGSGIPTTAKPKKPIKFIPAKVGD